MNELKISPFLFLSIYLLLYHIHTNTQDINSVEIHNFFFFSSYLNTRIAVAADRTKAQSKIKKKKEKKERKKKLSEQRRLFCGSLQRGIRERRPLVTSVRPLICKRAGEHYGCCTRIKKRQNQGISPTPERFIPGLTPDDPLRL